MDIQRLRDALSCDISTNISDEGKYGLASVLIIIYGKSPTIIMTEKPPTMNIHAGEISFPGGKFNKIDNDVLDTALRETKEEINLDVFREQVIGQLKPVTTLNSGFKIIPYIAVLDDIPKLKSNAEVETILHIPFIPFLKTLSEDPDPDHKLLEEMYVLRYKGKVVWGATARMLKQITDLLSNQNLI